MNSSGNNYFLNSFSLHTFGWHSKLFSIVPSADHRHVNQFVDRQHQMNKSMKFLLIFSICFDDNVSKKKKRLFFGWFDCKNDVITGMFCGEREMAVSAYMLAECCVYVFFCSLFTFSAHFHWMCGQANIYIFNFASIDVTIYTFIWTSRT